MARAQFRGHTYILRGLRADRMIQGGLKYPMDGGVLGGYNIRAAKNTNLLYKTQRNVALSEIAPLLEVRYHSTSRQ